MAQDSCSALQQIPRVLQLDQPSNRQATCGEAHACLHCRRPQQESNARQTLEADSAVWRQLQPVCEHLRSREQLPSRKKVRSWSVSHDRNGHVLSQYQYVPFWARISAQSKEALHDVCWKSRAVQVEQFVVRTATSSQEENEFTNVNSALRPAVVITFYKIHFLSTKTFIFQNK